MKKFGLELSQDQLSKFEDYYHELMSWNHKINLTAITDYASVQIKHFLDSLTIASVLPKPPPAGIRLLDIGTGAGFPGLPLKILYPNVKLTLLEATGKKAAFLEYIAGRLELSDVTVLYKRAEDAAHLPECRACFEVVTSRAVAELPVLLELALPFCRMEGQVIAMKKGNAWEEIDKSVRALNILGGKVDEVREITLPTIPDKRCLIAITKTALTPVIYPRRPGVPAKRPLV